MQLCVLTVGSIPSSTHIPLPLEFLSPADSFTVISVCCAWLPVVWVSLGCSPPLLLGHWPIIVLPTTAPPRGLSSALCLLLFYLQRLLSVHHLALTSGPGGYIFKMFLSSLKQLLPILLVSVRIFCSRKPLRWGPSVLRTRQLSDVLPKLGGILKARPAQREQQLPASKRQEEKLKYHEY